MTRIIKKEVPPGRDGVWFVIRKLKTFTSADLIRHCHVGKDGIRFYLALLKQKGIIEAAGRTPKTRGSWFTIYRLIRDTGHHAPELLRGGATRRVSAQQKMWMAMKPLGDFTVSDLTLVTQIRRRTALDYLVLLERFGFLTRLENASRNQAVWRMRRDRDTGPYAPTHLQKQNAMYDRNTHKVITLPESEAA